MNAFKILGIEPTQDKKTIKKAYAALVKKYHPEEDIQKWQEIHEAYQSALEWAEGRNYLTKTASISTQLQEEDVEEIFRQQVHEPVGEAVELNALFDNLEELSAVSKAEKSDRERQELRKAIAELERIGQTRKLKYESFKELFFREEYQRAIRHNDFLYSWSKLLERRNVNKKLHQLMKEQLDSIIQYRISNGEPEETADLIEPTRHTRMRIDAAYDRYKANRKRLSQLAVFGMLILLEMIPFVIYSVRDGANQRAQKEQEVQEVPDSLEKQIKDEFQRKMYFSEISLETMTGADIFWAGESWDGLAKFLMRADEEILSIVFPHTQTLEPGVLVLGEEFEIEKALQSEKNEEGTGNIENSYELVPLSLPFDNQIQIGEEIIDLPKKTVKFAVRTEGETDSVLLWVDPKEMGFEEGCEIYYFNGEAYQKVGRIWDDIQAERHYYDVLTYQVFWVQVSRLGENEFPVTMVPIK